MILNDLDFGKYVFGQSGVHGFFGEGDEYPHHKFYKFIPGFSFRNIGFVAKTVTLNPRIYPTSSNTELYQGYKIKKLFPSSVWFSPKSVTKGYVLNAVGLANPGLSEMLGYGKWQKRKDVFQLSIMLMTATPPEKLHEAREICSLLREHIPFNELHKYALQINFSCPNTGHAQSQDAEEIIGVLKIFRAAIGNVSLIPKFDLMVEPSTIVTLKPFCDAFCIGNTMPFGKKMSDISWSKLFPRGNSPLLRHFEGRFSGGLSGKPLFNVLLEWLRAMEKVDSTVKIIAGGGIMSKKDIQKLVDFKIVKAIALGTVAIVRPWKLKSLIQYGNELFAKKYEHDK